MIVGVIGAAEKKEPRERPFFYAGIELNASPR
jgi:hypothetical protein